MNLFDTLQSLRSAVPGARNTYGLSDDILQDFADDPRLLQAVADAAAAQPDILAELRQYGELDESELIRRIQRPYVNFYDPDAVNPYVACAANGPWLVSLHGAVLHDSGGYGMLGLGHAPEQVLRAMNGRQVMANIMTPGISQMRLAERVLGEAGHNRDTPPFSRILCMNSGSEAVSVATRISDINAAKQTARGGRHENRQIRLLAHVGGFHGRTYRPALASDSSAEAYQVLASFRGRADLITVQPNDIEGLRRIYADADREGWFIECFLMEPVMGEGNPGYALTPEYYGEARKLTAAHGSLLLVDSIQAGLRAHGCLSITDYPGFGDLDPPDMETYSKSINAGQYPLSILAMTEHAASLYEVGVYGNTMTANPRALDVACAVLDAITPALRENIRARGAQFLQEFATLQREFPDAVTGFQGTGLLCALALNPDGYTVVGKEGVELYLRERGIGVIHGGKNALRFTPHLRSTNARSD